MHAMIDVENTGTTIGAPEAAGHGNAGAGGYKDADMEGARGAGEDGTIQAVSTYIAAVGAEQRPETDPNRGCRAWVAFTAQHVVRDDVPCYAMLGEAMLSRTRSYATRRWACSC